MPSDVSNCKARIPKLSFAENRGYGEHVSYRDSAAGTSDLPPYSAPHPMLGTGHLPAIGFIKSFVRIVEIIFDLSEVFSVPFSH